MPQLFITTSWDDGHPLDLRLAELLARYDLPGTFYVPRRAEQTVMADAQLRELAKAFEIGAHTLNHVVLPEVADGVAEREIRDSKTYLEDLLGRPVPMFCFPRGRFRARHVRMLTRAGFLGARTTELFSLRPPVRRDGIALLPTSIQAYPHGPVSYLRNFARRLAWGNLGCYLQLNAGRQWTRTAAALLGRAAERGGVFHLWGHSWEVEAYNQWSQLEDVFRFMNEQKPGAQPLSNGEICDSVSRGAAGPGGEPGGRLEG